MSYKCTSVFNTFFQASDLIRLTSLTQIYVVALYIEWGTKREHSGVQILLLVLLRQQMQHTLYKSSL